MTVDHWMTFSTFAEQSYFEYPRKGVYKGVIINANMAAYAPAGLAAFLLEKTARSTKYLVDPLTHAFQHDPGLISDQSGNPKRSILELARAYGSPLSDIVGKKPLLPADLALSSKLKEFVQRTLNFQASQIAKYMQESDVAKYMNDEEELRPYALVAPYFYLTETTFEEWLPLNVQSAQIASTLVNHPQKCFAAVIVDRGILLNSEIREQVVEQMSAIQLSGYLIWVDNLDEKAAAAAELEGLLALSRGLRGGKDREVINLHGGYFSIAAAGNLGDGAMTGVAHGPEFGEFRSVVPVGGGIPVARYYVPQLHARIAFRDALSMFSKKDVLDNAETFHEKVCGCDECIETIEGDIDNFVLFGESTAKTVRRRHGLVRIEFPTTDAKLRSLRHYLQRKYREYLSVAELDRKRLLRNLRDGEAEYLPVAGHSGVSHLRLWRRVFGDLN